MSCTDAGATLLGPLLLDATVNDRPLRRPGMPHSSHSQSPRMVPHNIYAARGDDEWIAIACRDDREWRALANVVDEPWARDPEYDTLDGRSAKEAVLDAALDQWCSVRDKFETQVLLQDAGVPAAAVQRPEERIEFDPATAAWGLWPMVHHREIGAVRVDGLPVHFSETDWSIAHGAPSKQARICTRRQAGGVDAIAEHAHVVRGERLAGPDGATVIEFDRSVMVYRRGAAPTRPGPRAPGQPL